MTTEWLALVDAADALADTYGRVWAKDAKFYAYQDARDSLRVSIESLRENAPDRWELQRAIDRGTA